MTPVSPYRIEIRYNRVFVSFIDVHSSLLDMNYQLRDADIDRVYLNSQVYLELEQLQASLKRRHARRKDYHWERTMRQLEDIKRNHSYLYPNAYNDELEDLKTELQDLQRRLDNLITKSDRLPF